jgi:mono/diheme cytochrome c family protein
MKFHKSPIQMAAAAIGIVGVMQVGSVATGAARVAPSGGELYVAHCAACHGSGGKGDGRAACDFPTRPADLTDSSIAEETDAELLRRLSHPPKPMPSYDTLLDDAERREIVRYLRTLSSRGTR